MFGYFLVLSCTVVSVGTEKKKLRCTTTVDPQWINLETS